MNMPYPYYPSYTQYAPASSVIWISGEREAQMYPVAPNNAVTLWSQSEPVVYLKQADASGKPSMKVYDIVERRETPQEEKEYVTKTDLTSVLSAVEGIKADIEAMKGDIYGIAGKRKTVKKEEVEE